MESVITLLLFCQAFGALIGALTAVWGEIAYMRALRDGTIDVAERAHLDSIANGLRFGMSLVLLSSLGLVIAAYILHTGLQPALSASYWTFIVLTLLIIGISWARSRRRISFAFGSAVIFSAWWFLAYLTLGWLPPLSFGAAVAFFVVATALFYAVLQSGRFVVLHKR